MAVAIINWNTRDLLRRCLHSVLAEAPVEVVVVDNGSSDGSADMVAQEFPTVTLKVLAANPGYGAGCNAGVRACSLEYVLVLNSDTLVRPGALAALTGVLDRQERAAIVGPRIVNPDGSLQPSCFPFPGPAARLFRREPFATVAAWVPWLRERYVGRWRYDRMRRVPWVLGAAFGIRRTSFEEVGGFDETFVMYYEEVDLCYRLRAHHWETLFAPVTDVTHIGGASTSQRRGEMLARYELSLIAFHRRHDRGMALALGVGVVRLHAAVRFLGDAIRYRLTSGREQRERLAEDLAVWRDIMFRASHTM